MSEMVDSVFAKAIRAGRGCDIKFPCPFCLWGPDQLTPEWDETGCVWLARAAIEAMRQPTDKMICAALDAHDRGKRGYSDQWNAMIDEALK